MVTIHKHNTQVPEHGSNGVMYMNIKPLRQLLSTYFLPLLSLSKYLTKPVSKWRLNVALRAQFQYPFDTILWNTRRMSTAEKKKASTTTSWSARCI